MCDNAFGLANALLGLIYNVIWGLIGKADDDRPLGSDSHSGGSKESGQDGKSGEAHVEEFGLVCARFASGAFIRCSCFV